MARLFLRLVAMRMRWYASETGRILLRYWLWCVVAATALPLPALIRGLASPLTELLAPGRGAGALLAHLLALHAFAATWAALQRGAISGGPFMRYASSLPLSRRARRGVDLIVLAAADNLFLVIFAVAFAISTDAEVTTAWRLAVLAIVLVLALAAQLAILERNWIAVAAIAIADIPIAAALAAQGTALSWLAFTAAPVLVAAAFLGRRPHELEAISGKALRSVWLRRGRLLARLPLPLLIQCKALARHSVSVMLRIGAAVGLGFGADILLDVFAYDSRSLPTIVAALAAVAIICSGLYRVLAKAHAGMAAYLRALPTPIGFWPIRDMALVAQIGSLPLLILLIPAAAHGLATAPILVGLACADLALIAAMRWPVTHGGRYAVLLSVALAGSWSTAAMAALAR